MSVGTNLTYITNIQLEIRHRVLMDPFIDQLDQLFSLLVARPGLVLASQGGFF
jgi:hypothetical protein